MAPWRRDPRLRALSKAQVASQPWCSLCGAEENLTADHIIPVSKGGNPHDPANLDTLCRRCNSSKGAW